MTKIASVDHGIYHTEWGNIGSYKLNDIIYYSGSYDSFANIQSNVIAFNGTIFSDVGNAASLNQDFIFNSKDDTLFLLGSNSIQALVSGKWYTFYQGNKFDYFHGMALSGEDVIISTRTNNSIKRIRNGFVLDSLNSTLYRPILNNVGGKILVSSQSYPPKPQTVYQLESNLKLSPLFVNQRVDSFDLHFASLDTRAYFWGRKGVYLNADNYNNIAEINLDSLKSQNADTIHIVVFRDINKNGIKDNTEVGNKSLVREYNSGNEWSTDDEGLLELVYLDNEDPRFAFTKESIFDSCYVSAFTGGKSSKTYNSAFTSDTIYLPIWRSGLQNKNIVLNAYSPRNARLNTDQEIYFKVFNRDCDEQNSKVQLKIELDPNTDFVSSKPNFSNKTGNTLSFDLNVLANQLQLVKLTVKYSNTKYQLNDLVKHGAKIVMSFT
ncbi:MAG: hypothetical protein R2852_03460 [Bacteroidia bacterium]